MLLYVHLLAWVQVLFRCDSSHCCSRIFSATVCRICTSQSSALRARLPSVQHCTALHCAQYITVQCTLHSTTLGAVQYTAISFLSNVKKQGTPIAICITPISNTVGERTRVTAINEWQQIAAITAGEDRTNTIQSMPSTVSTTYAPENEPMNVPWLQLLSCVMNCETQDSTHR